MRLPVGWSTGLSSELMRQILTVAGLFVACQLLCRTAPAQAFQHLVTTADGSVLYFSTPARQKGTAQQYYSKIFRWTAASGVQLVAEGPEPGLETCGPPTFCDLRTPQVSLDGSVLAYTGTRMLQGCRLCPTGEKNRATVERSGKKILIDGSLVLSSNGHYAATTTIGAELNKYHMVTDLTTGQSTVVAGGFNGSNLQFTDDGTIITLEPMAIILTDRLGGTRVLLTTQYVSDAIIDRSGATVVYRKQYASDSPSGLVVIDVKTGIETQVVEGLSIGYPTLSMDGSTIFFVDYVSRYQLCAVEVGCGNRRQITHEKDGIEALVVSGNGMVAYSAGSRLLRIDLASGSTTEL